MQNFHIIGVEESIKISALNFEGNSLFTYLN